MAAPRSSKLREAFQEQLEKSSGEKDWEEEHAGSTSVVQCNLKADGSGPCDQMTEEGADSRRVAGQDPVVEEEGREVDRIGEGRDGQTACLENDSVDGQCEECGTSVIALLDTSSAVDGCWSPMTRKEGDL